MDIDSYIVGHRETWDRLQQLTTEAARSPRRLSADELDEMIHLYQRTSSHLAHARAAFDDQALLNRLSRLVGSARGVIYRSRANPWRAVAQFFALAFPGAVLHNRRFMATAAILLFVPALALGTWLTGNDRAREAAIPAEVAEAVAQGDFRDYYSSQAAQSFQAQVTINNLRVGGLSFASGILLGIPTAMILVVNGLDIGTVGAVMHSAGKGAEFWGLILPHGLLELMAVVLAAGAGLSLGWAVISPGDRTRGEALVDAGLRAVTVLAGAALCFVVAGVIEAWVTPSGAPTAVRVGIGVLAAVALFVYLTGLGLRALRLGVTGAPGDLRRYRERRAAEAVTAAPSP